MIRRVAILCDLHLPDRSDTLKEQVLDWVVRELSARQVDLIVAAGDMTAIGTVRAATRVREKLESVGIPLMMTPGNADMRSPGQTAQVLEALHTETETLGILLLNTARIRLSESDGEMLKMIPADSRLLAITHCPITELPQEDADLLRQCQENGKIEVLVAGHVHRFSENPLGAFQTVRALDPDKSLGGGPAFSIFEYHREAVGVPHWQRQDIAWPVGDQMTLPEEERVKIREYFGFAMRGEDGESLMRDMEEALQAAPKELAIRWEKEAFSGETVPQEFLDKLGVWRQKTGGHLTLILQDAAQASLALTLGAERVVLDIPDYSVEQMEMKANREAVAEPTAEALRPLVAAGISILIRNSRLDMHSSLDQKRRYGCLAQECREWISLLQNMTGAREKQIGLALDLAHARSNKRLTTRFNVCDWYAECARQIQMLLLYQLRDLDDPLPERCIFQSLYEEPVVIGGPLQLFRLQLLPLIPMILECRQFIMTPAQNWKNLRAMI